MSIQDAITADNPKNQEPIPGYRLLMRIGRGGYGEVWKTLAPGGVPKAIKLIYGDDSSRMATELNALNRIKDVRHPFLLSIERIEQHEDLLAIVTELGDKNLQQHFQDCRATGLPGVPQNDLLLMLRDVADVLDYIYQEYALQHLDIKPANLLLFGRRLKVADFGMVKNIYERSASLVQGLTPTYAAPEIFERQPTRSSDQYSLAILYHEMLTGVLPFNGITAARLATQHLRETPDLSQLPTAQQPIIARALSKDPQQRFSSCMELVEELTAAARRSPVGTAVTSKEQPIGRDAPVKSPVASTVASLSSATVQPQAAASGDRTVMPAAQDHKLRPTIVIGIGGSAGKALQRLRLRIADRLGGVGALRAFKMLFLDVDHDAMNEINHDQQTWSELETVPTPLRSSAEYREQGHLHRRWLSRRWLFNVPRNLRTDGFRPLGRLALLSNVTRVLASLRSAIQQVTSACPGSPPRILLVASISGGTGSGMLLDLAYAARNELRNAGFPEAPVDGVLLHSTPAGTGRDKAVLNAIAALGELDHYSAPGNFYPGEPLLQIPPFHGNNQTFTSTQFLHLGRDLEGAGWLRAMDNVAEHLYCRLLTNLDLALMRPQSPLRGKRPTVDLVQVHQIGGYFGSFVDDLTRQLCVDMIDGWCGSEVQPDSEEHKSTSAGTLLLNALERSQNAKHQQLTTDAKAKSLACGIDPEQFLKHAREMLQQELTMSQRDFLQALFSEALKSVDEDAPDHEVARMAIALQDRAIGLDFGERPAESPRNSLYDLLNSRLASQAMPIAARFIGWVCDLVDQPQGGVDAALHAAEAGRNRIRDLIMTLGKEIQDGQTQQTHSRILLTSPPGPDSAAKSSRGWLFRRSNSRAAVAERLIEHGLCTFNDLLDVLVQCQIRAVEAIVTVVIDQLLIMWQELKQLGKRINLASDAANSDSGLPTIYEQSMRRSLLEHRSRLVEELRARIEQEVLTGPRKLQRYLQQRCSYDQAIGEPLRHHARQVVLRSINQLLCSMLKHHSQGLGDQDLKIDATLEEILRQPWMMDGGDDERAVLVVPNETSESTFRNRMSPNLLRMSIVPAPTNNVTVCRERRQTTIQEVIQSITQGQKAMVTVAANLFTRIDVEWTSSVGIDQPAVESEPPLTTWTEVAQTVQLS